MSEFDFSDFGPLPRADSNSVLEEDSFTALRSSLPSDRFRFRDERANDTGVDASIEILVNSLATNWRAQIQLKGTDSTETLSDGSVSLSIEVSNLNHLLFSNSALYVLYIRPRNELRFVWARDERTRIESSNPRWREQGTVTLKFSAPITPETLNEIYNRIWQIFRLQRQLNDNLDGARNAERVMVSINPRTHEITNSRQAKQILIDSGTAMVSSGLIRQVQDLIRLLDVDDAQEPRIQLVQAHAETHLGRYQRAIGCLREASLRQDELSESERFFLQSIQDSCDFQTGRISIAELTQRLEEQTQRDDARFAVGNRLQQIRYTVLADPNQARILLPELQRLVEEIEGSPEISPAFKIYAKIYLVEVSGTQFLNEALSQGGEAFMQLMMGNSPDMRALYQAMVVGYNEWQERAVRLIHDAEASGNPRLMGAAILTSGGIGSVGYQSMKTMSSWLGVEPPITLDNVQSLINSVRGAERIFSDAGALEEELRAKMLIADLYDLCGSQNEARAIANEVLPKAKIMEYADVIARAEQHVSGNTLARQLASVGSMPVEKRVTIAANESDELLRANVAQMLRLLRLPAERLPHLESWYFSKRSLAREKVSWCKYINVVDDGEAVGFEREAWGIGACSRFGYRSEHENSDWAAVMSEFKRLYCENCEHRSPINRA